VCNGVPDKFGLTLEPTKTKLELAGLELDWHIALMRGAERNVLRIRAELEAQGLQYNGKTGKWEETNVFTSRYDHDRQQRGTRRRF
jgi:hypothetical protein